MFILSELGQKPDPREIERVFNVDLSAAAYGSRDAFVIEHGLD